MSLTEALSWLQTFPTEWAWAILFGAAFIEYVLPPFPGDLVVVTGVVMATTFDGSLAAVFTWVTLGAVLGALVDFELGRQMLARKGLTRLPRGAQDAVRGLVTRFERHGAWYLALNRFLPGVRAFFFVAAGLAGLPRRSVLLWSTASAVAWNGLLVAVGYGLGTNLEAIEIWITRYTVIAWLFILAVIVVVIVRLRRASVGAPRDGSGPQ